MNKSYDLKEELIKKIKHKIREDASPRHIPSKIIKVSDIPRTKNGKIVELAVKDVIEGNKIKNIQALANPEILKEFKDIKELKY
jgi:acetoacetyl-CoA synthetase